MRAVRGIVIVQVVLLGALLGWGQSLSWAQDEAKELAYTYGTVREMTETSLVVAEYDEETGGNTDVTYALEPTTEVGNAASIRDIKVGDELDIEYVDQGGTRVAKRISVWKPEEEPEPAW